MKILWWQEWNLISSSEIPRGWFRNFERKIFKKISNHFVIVRNNSKTNTSSNLENWAVRLFETKLIYRFIGKSDYSRYSARDQLMFLCALSGIDFELIETDRNWQILKAISSGKWKAGSGWWKSLKYKEINVYIQFR